MTYLTPLPQLQPSDYVFIWTPEGRTLTTIKAASYVAARKEFRLRFPAHGRHMAEVAVERRES